MSCSISGTAKASFRTPQRASAPGCIRSVNLRKVLQCECVSNGIGNARIRIDQRRIPLIAHVMRSGRVWRYAVVGILLLMFFGIVQRLTFRDSVRGLDLFFYALPYPVILLVSAGMGFFAVFRRSWWIAGS